MTDIITIYFEDAQTVKTLPINPEELKIERPGNNDNTEVIGLGEINIIKTPKLRPVTIESFFPADENPQDYINFFNEIMDKKRKVRLICKEFELNMMVSVDGFEYAMRAGEEDDRYYTLELQEWRDYSPRKVVVEKPVEDIAAAVIATPEEKRVEQPPKEPQTYTVKKGDSLWKIAKKYTSQGTKWPELYANNKTIIGGNPNLIYPNQVLNIPEDWL